MWLPHLGLLGVQLLTQAAREHGRHALRRRISGDGAQRAE